MYIIFPGSFALFTARKIILFSRHDTARMDDIQKDESDEHRGGIEDVLIGFMYGDGRV